MPIYLDTDMAAGWESLQTLNTANLPATIQNPGPISAQWGIRITKIQIIPNGVTAAATILIVNPDDNSVLFKYPVTTTQAPVEVDFENNFPNWLDFKATGMTTGVVALLIWYRA